VGALGTIVAIFASAGIAIYVLVKQHRHDKALFREQLAAEENAAKQIARQKNEIIRRIGMHAVIACSSSAQTIYDSIEGDSNPSLVLKVHADLVRDNKSMLLAIPMHELRSPELVSATFDIGTLSSRMEDYLRRFHQQSITHKLDIQDLKNAMEEYVNTAIARRETFAKAIEAVSKSLG
jgi:D-arabinose 1-dehydrogenase-like Zn-dependent alcohol dehydrogenase